MSERRLPRYPAAVGALCRYRHVHSCLNNSQLPETEMGFAFIERRQPPETFNLTRGAGAVTL